MDEASPAVAVPFRPFPESQLEFTGLRLSKGYCNGQYPTDDGDSRVCGTVHTNQKHGSSLSEISCSGSLVSGAKTIANSDESKKDLNFRINSSNLQRIETPDAVADLVGEEINGSEEFDPRSTAQSEKKIISRTESRSLFEFKNVPLYGVTSICGRRPEMEDAVSAIPRFLQVSCNTLSEGRVSNGFNPRTSAHFFGIFDGHGGSQVANYCRERAHRALAEEIAKEKPALCDGETWQEKWKRALFNSFLKIDSEIQSVAPETVGSTAVVALVFPTHIFVANCGDSRALLCRGKTPLPLSVDHKPDREDEAARIEAAGGKVIRWNGARVFGVLAMSRSIGDRYLKPSIIPDPEVTVTRRAKEDDCLILASDGLWDVMTCEEVCDVARKRILLWHKKRAVAGEAMLPVGTAPVEGMDPAAQSAAEYLSKLALQKGSKDNISVVVVDLKAQRKFKSKALNS
ncbi:PREDICTED: protein phosphatase 2C 77-like [Tarenaya hassleriana]|uniref:protein phosphatase 2C 77-like n=1 Tax=Tarenaya hassleriana TaxID=28532 RepID=UPI00053C5D1D|nr:PREDICTED: protein phosphatase 2C 77-like [Tarenaya hassleriana]XP_010545368.1 PREDICTED: protein phosphatase 2C 77-like [Tarenaya hassleriana]XP_010545370.1 PREDICTED: protein phosphatase 2C 77-like [Tarenaya hassleriana]XP_010545371.1 PREDICTED: protein phosphatase 2C 77-like [Tarenaya hassleriana]